MWAAVGGAAIGAVGSMVAANKQSSAAQSAADTSSEAAKYSADLQKQMYDQTRADQTPWRNTGAASLNKLSSLLGLSQNSGQSAPTVESRADIYNRLKNQFTTGGNQNQNTYNGGLSAFTGIYSPALHGNSSDFVDYGNNNSPVTYDTNALNAAVESEYAKQQQAYDQFNNQQQSASSDPSYGSLLKPFSMADYQADPGYAFRLSEGEKGIDRALASRGLYNSGSALKELDKYNSDQASQEYGNAYNRYNMNQGNQFNRLATVAGVGQSANNQLQSANNQYANNTGNLMMTSAANQGNSILAGANAQASGYAGLGSALGSYRWPSTGSQNTTGYGGGYDSNTGLGNTSVNWGL
jgi:hypothetical protein